jgi:hypothetical protein
MDMDRREAACLEISQIVGASFNTHYLNMASGGWVGPAQPVNLAIEDCINSAI